MKKTALITGITGQDGSFLAEFLVEKGYEVHGVLRRSSSFNTGRIEHLYLDEWVRDMKQQRLINLHYGDMTDSSSLVRIIQQTQLCHTFLFYLFYPSIQFFCREECLIVLGFLFRLGYRYIFQYSEGEYGQRDRKSVV